MTTINAKTTKPVLLAHIAAQDKLLRTQALDIEALRTQLAMAKPAAPRYQAPVADHQAYYAYVARCKEAARRQGQKVVGYMTFSQWADQRDHNEYVYSGERDFDDRRAGL